MKNEKNAFTLIELLAIIVILAIIAVITVPIILNIIENSRKGAAIDSAYGFRDSIQQYYLSKSVENTANQLPTDVYDVNTGLPSDFEVSGTKPSDGWVKLEKGQVVDYSLKFGDYVVSLDTTTNTPISTKNGELKLVESPESWFTFNENTKTITGFSETWQNLNDSTKYDIVIPNKINNIDVENIGSAAFSNSEIKSLVIGNGVKTVGFAAFAGTYISELTLPDSVISIGGGIGTQICISCSNLEKLVIGNGLQTIPGGAFQNLQKLKELTIGNSVTSIGDGAFQGTSIETLIIPDTVTTIGGGAFMSTTTNSALSTITIGSSVTTIGGQAFADNTTNNNKLTVYNKSNLTLTGTNYFNNRTNIEFK